MVARLDGRGFTRLTKEVCSFEPPFDERFRDLMIQTTEALFHCGFRVIYAHTASDEISLLFDPNEQLFGRKLRKYHSTLAGEASAQFSVALGKPASFDCRVSQLPTIDLVVDYFRWRHEDAARNALNGWCYWSLREQGQTKQQATNSLQGLSRSQKNELLYDHGVNFNDLPAWQKRGVGFYWETYQKAARDPIADVEVLAKRQRLQIEWQLPLEHKYADLVRSIVDGLKGRGV